MTGKVVYVEDGDTLVMLVGQTQMEVRLSSIDAPETAHTKKSTGRIGQPFSRNSKEHMARIKGLTVEANCFEKDRYKRDVCEIFVDGKSVNQDMVRSGWAWANTSNNRRYLRDKSLPALEEAARSQRAGLWADSSPVPPWEWRERCWKAGDCQLSR